MSDSLALKLLSERGKDNLVAQIVPHAMPVASIDDALKTLWLALRTWADQPRENDNCAICTAVPRVAGDDLCEACRLGETIAP